MRSSVAKIPPWSTAISIITEPGCICETIFSETNVGALRPGIRTEDRTTTHDDPVYTKYGVLHYAVPNMPGAVARTSTIALTNATLPYAARIAKLGHIEAAKEDDTILTGFNVFKGKVTNPDVAESLDKEYAEVTSLF